MIPARTLTGLSRDERVLLFTENGVGGGPRSSVYIRSTDGAPAVRLGDGFAWALSPDGRWAVASSGPGLPRVLDLLAVGPGEIRRIDFLVNPVTGARRLWREIVPPDAAGIMNVTTLLVTPDGRSCAYSWHRALSDLILVEGL